MRQMRMHLQKRAVIGLKLIVTVILHLEIGIKRMSHELFRNMRGMNHAYLHAVNSSKNASYKLVFIIEFCADDLCR